MGAMGEVPGSAIGWSWGRGGSRYVVLVVGVMVLLGFGVLGSPAPAHAAGRASVSVGSAPKLPAGAVRTGTLAATTVLHADVTLAQRDPAGLEQFATAVSTPTSPLYRHYLAAGQVSAMFGPTAATTEAVRTALDAAGLTTGAVAANRVFVPVSGTVAKLASAFHTSFATYRLPDGRMAYANTSAPRVPSAIAADVTGVVGLDDLALAQPALDRPSNPRALTRTAAHQVPSALPSAGPTPCAAVQTARNDYGGAGWLTNQLASSYQMSPLYAQGDLGAGQTVAVLELEPYTPSDIRAYQSCYHTSASVRTVAIDGGATGGQSGEAALDIENIAGFAPRSRIWVYSAPNNGADLLHTYSKMVSDDVAKTISTSWGLCEQDSSSAEISAESTTFQQAAAQGQSIYAAAGDDGSTDCYGDSTSETELSVDDPASQPFVTGVGGTTLATQGPPPGETTWDEAANGSGAGGGGISTVWPMPTYQSASHVPGVINAYSSKAPCGAVSGYCREVPDISADADPYSGYYIYNAVNGGWFLIGGTSAAAPLWAGMTALINALPQCTTRLGFANPTLYSVAARAGLGGFHDIKVGSNAYISQAKGHYPATTGYDLANGIGTPSATTLVARTCQPVTQLHPLTPHRLLDTRKGTGGTTGPVASHHTVTLKVRGVGGVPSNATAVVVNLTVTSPTGSGYLTAYPSGGTRPNASNLNFTRRVTRANLAVVPIGSNGDISLYNGSSGSVQLVADAFGYDSRASGSKFTATSPVRVLDTRNGTGAHGPVAAGRTLNLQVAGKHEVPAGATAVVLNVTVTAPKKNGYVTVWPSGTSEPKVSNLNFTPGQTIPNLAVVPVGSNGKVSIRNSSSGTVQIVADQFGYYAPTAATSFTATTPTRLLDTRNRAAAVGARHTLKVKVSGAGGIPTGVKAIILNVTETSPTRTGYLTVYPAGITRPTASNLNFTKGLTAPNLVLVPVSSSGYVDLYNGSAGSVQLIADCFGFYR